MSTLTKRQTQILNFIKEAQIGGTTPSLREIASSFGFKSMTAARDHVLALQRKGVLEFQPNAARSLRVISPLAKWQRPAYSIPVFGEIPAGPPADKVQEAIGCITVDVNSIGIRPTPRTFALQVRGDSMIGKHITDGDYVILEHGKTPRSGDVVAALIDNENTLKTFVLEKGKPFLRAENPRYPKIIPAQELVIQGVMVALIRRVK